MEGTILLNKKPGSKNPSMTKQNIINIIIVAIHVFFVDKIHYAIT
jgi:hypothetical protein